MENQNKRLLIRKFPLGFIETELKKIDSNVLDILKGSEEKIIKLRELDKKLSEFFYTTKFFNMMSETEGYEDIFIVETLIPYNFLIERWIKISEGYLRYKKIKSRNKINENKFIDVIIYEFRRAYKK